MKQYNNETTTKSFHDNIKENYNDFKHIPICRERPGKVRYWQREER